MKDLIYLSLLFGFFLVAFLYMELCDRLANRGER